MTTPTKLITIILMFSCAAALIIWDTVVATNNVVGDTISETIFKFTHDHAVAGMGLALALGIILGHLVWGQTPQTPQDKEK
jgi:hypothetical protein